ncbi:MAG TPA: hypothetical protein VKV02_01565 [Acidobacteriaceae bacterium]|nr:hypothetical protein [Acidobacteriaceae bacterium]
MPALKPAMSHGEPLSSAPDVTAPVPEAVLWQSVLALVVLILFTVAFQHPGLVVKRAYGIFTNDVFYMRGIYRFNVAWLGALLTSWLLQPAAAILLRRWRARTSPGAQRLWAAVAVALACVLCAAFVIVFGRWQFGGFDYNIIMEVGWRQILGQRPYVDFPTTSPPLFNLGIALAFRLFGVTWDGMLDFTALFTGGTLVWLYALLRKLGLTAFAALGTACTLEVATMLSCCFWWYNNSVLLLAAIFFLCTLLLTRENISRFAEISYVASLTLLSLGKPNIAGVTIVGCLAVLLLSGRRPVRVLVLSAMATALSVLIFVAVHISIPAMLTMYHGAAKERGAFSAFGYDEYDRGEKYLIKLWYVALCLPLLSTIRPFLTDLREKGFRRAAFWLFFPLSAMVAVYGLRGNGELRDVETTVLVASISLLAFSLHTGGRLLQRFSVAIFCAMAASNLYTGISRDRVYTIGPHMFFEWQDRNHVLTRGGLRNMRVSETFLEVNDEVQGAVHDNAGPFFFGPRVDYNYMALGLPSPLHFPAWWHPGTAFDRADMPKIVANWERQRYPTLIFLKGDYTFYPDTLLNELKTDYLRDDHYPRLTVYRRRPGM